MSIHESTLALLGGWALVAALILALLTGALLRPGYLQVLSLVVMESLLVAWALWLARML